MPPKPRLDPSVPATQVQLELPDELEADFRASFADHDLDLVIAALMRHAVNLRQRPAQSEAEATQRWHATLRQVEVRYGLLEPQG